MSRVIKFRFWNHIVGRMTSKQYTLSEIHDEEVNFKLLIPMEFTGLKDISGIEIYENDIVRFQTTEGNVLIKKVAFCEKGKCLMIGNFPYINLKESAFIQPSEIEFEVIGNIYQNPELLKN